MKIPECSASTQASLRRTYTEVLQLINEQLSTLAQKPISEAELNSAKEYIKGNMYINAENNDYRMNRLAKNEFLFGHHVSFEEVEKKINMVSLRRYTRLVARHLQPG